MHLPEDLLDRLDLETAVGRVAPARGEFFPSRLEPAAALVDLSGYAAWLRAQLLAGTADRALETVWVPRRSHGVRPVPDIPFAERVAFEGLTGLLADHLGEDQERLGLRSLSGPAEGDRQQFERLPIEAGADYIVLADVASFYEYVDHPRLAQDVVELTGDVQLADALREHLGNLMGREFGLPQGPRSSDVLADLYLGAVDRELVRDGVLSWRFNDDYLLCADDESDAALLLVRLERALRSRGLALNNAKTRVIDSETYKGWVEELNTRLTDAAIAAVGDVFYGFDPEEFGEVELGDLSAESIEQVFADILDSQEPDPYDVNSRLLPQALQLLAKAESLAPLERLDELVAGWAPHARIISLYLRSLIGGPNEAAMVKRVAETLREAGSVIPWVRGWLLDPLARCDGRIGNSVVSLIQAWLTEEREPWFVRGRCAVVMARRERILVQEAFSDLFAHAPSPARADLVAAVVLAEPSWAHIWLRTLQANEPLLRRLADMPGAVPVAEIL